MEINIVQKKEILCSFYSLFHKFQLFNFAFALKEESFEQCLEVKALSRRRSLVIKWEEIKLWAAGELHSWKSEISSLREALKTISNEKTDLNVSSLVENPLKHPRLLGVAKKLHIAKLYLPKINFLSVLS